MDYLVNLDLKQNQLLNARIQNLATDPASPVAGQIYYNTAINKYKFYNGTAWIIIDDETTVKDLIGALFADTNSVDFTYTSPTQITADVKRKTSSMTVGAQGSLGEDILGIFVDLSLTDGTKALPGNATVSQLTAPATDLSMNSHKITNVVDPTSPQDAATKNYVDLKYQGIQLQEIRTALNQKLFENSEYVIDYMVSGDAQQHFTTNMTPVALKTYSFDTSYYYEFQTFGVWSHWGTDQSDGVDKSRMYLHFLKSADGITFESFKSVTCNYTSGDTIDLTIPTFMIYPEHLGAAYAYIYVVVSRSATYNPAETKVYPTQNYSRFWFELKLRRVLKASWKKRFYYSCISTTDPTKLIFIPGGMNNNLPMAGYYHIDYYFEFAQTECAGPTPPDSFPTAYAIEVSGPNGSVQLRSKPEGGPSQVIQGSGIVYIQDQAGANIITITIYYANDGQIHNITYGYVHLHYLNSQDEGMLLTL